jgi:RluA family pseudouridine synthase
MDPFASDAGSKIFRFQFEAEAQPLKPYLLERYQYGREPRWRDTFYPERVRLNGAPVAEETWARPGDTIAYRHLRAEEPPAPAALPVLYEDEWLLAVHKPDSVPVSPSGLYYFSSLALLARELFASPELTPLHRLDLETSGVLLLARRRADLARFHGLFTAHAIDKRYLALVPGAFPLERRELSGRIVPHPASAIHTKLWLDPAGESNSLTRVLDVAHHGRCSELLLQPVTGKTNQIRVHLAHAGHPIVGDKKYQPDERVFLDWLVHRDDARVRERLGLPRQALLCQSLAFIHPFTGRPVSIAAPPGAWAEKIAGVVAAPRLGYP